MALNVGELKATLDIDDGKFGAKLSDARQKLGTLDTAANAARSSLAQIGQGTGDISTGLSRGANAAGDLKAAASQAQSAVGGIGGEAAGAAGKLGQVQSSVSSIGDAAQKAKAEVGKIGDGAGAAGAKGGSDGAAGFMNRFKDGIGDLAGKGGPIAGALLGVAALGLAAGALLVQAIQDGMDTEKRQDLFQASTGLDEATTRRFGIAAGEAYANAFGESIADNMSTAKAALQSGLLDTDATAPEIQGVIEQLTGVSEILGEDIPTVARAAGQAIKSGFAKDGADAMDILVKASQAGINVSEDLLDTINEYGVQFVRLGLQGPDAIGLISQAMKAGARDSDLAADALKEFAIRAIDGSASSSAAYQAIGLSAEEMTAKIAGGGAGAREGLRQVLDGLRAIPDPADRSAAAVGLFGTQAEDLGDALYAMDLNTAAAGLGNFAGAAKDAVTVLGDNAASSVQGAFNSISVAADGLKAALAQAFGPYIRDFADTVSNNRAGVIGFFIDVGNGAFGVARSLATMAANGLDNIADLTGAITDLAVNSLATASSMAGAWASVFDAIGMDDLAAAARTAQTSLGQAAIAAVDVGQGAEAGLRAAADGIRDNVIPGLDAAQQRFNDFALPVQQSAAFNDALTKVNNTISGFSAAADGSTISLTGWNGQLNTANAQQQGVITNLQGLAQGMRDQTVAGAEAGASVADLTTQYFGQRNELVNTLVQMGLNQQQAIALVNQYGLVPTLVSTVVDQPGMITAQSAADILRDKVISIPNEKTVITQALTDAAVARLETLGYKVTTLPNGTVSVEAQTARAESDLNYTARNRSSMITQYVSSVPIGGGAGTAPVPLPRADGGFVTHSYAAGGTRLPDSARIQPETANLVQWAEPGTGGEAYIPLAASKRDRSVAIWRQTGELLGQFAEGGIRAAGGGGGGGVGEVVGQRIAVQNNYDGFAYQRNIEQSMRATALRIGG